MVFFHPDHLGSTAFVTDSQGRVMERVEYTPYGGASTEEPASPFRFTGQRQDSSTGLYYYKARYYDPEMGRFIQPDPFVQALHDPQTLNRYSYVRDNPLTYRDPSGYFFEWIVGFVIAALISVTVEAAISSFRIDGEFAKALRFTGAAASAAVGSFTAGLGSVMAGRLVASSAYATLALDTGEGRQLAKNFAEGLQDLGVGRHVSQIIASTVTHAVTSSAIFIGVNTLSPMPAPAQRPDDLLQTGPEQGEGGRTVHRLAIEDRAGTRIESAGQGLLGSAPAFGDARPGGFLSRVSDPFQRLAQWIGVRHTSFLGPTGQDTAVRPFVFLLPGGGTCQQQTFGGLISQSGLGGVQALAQMGRGAGWTFFLTSAFYGVHGSLGLHGLTDGAVRQAIDER